MAGLVPAFIFFKLHMGRNMHTIKPLVKFSDFVPNFGKFWAWLNQLAEDTTRKDIEAYLATAVDTHDLERKMQILYRRGIV